MTRFVVRRVRSALRMFLDSQAKGGIILMGAAVAAMIAANSALSDIYFHTLHHVTGPVLAPAIGPMTVHLWINDGAMALFFLVVGLEIKRELVDGGLSDWSDRRLPFIAAAAGMILPAIVYLVFAGADPAMRRGWAIPAATDIAFAIGVLALLGKRAPAALVLFLTTVAIVDDMGAVAIIALVYTDQINVAALIGAVLVTAGMAVMNPMGVRRVWPYFGGFAVLWLLVLQSGVHATVAGVIAAMTVPITPARESGEAGPSTLHRLEHGLHPLVAYVVVPVFGFANAGVSLAGMTPASLVQPLVLGIALGLFIGKQLGIMGGIAIAVRFRIATRPGGASWTQIYGISLLAGIGFTMSLFIGGLAFPGSEAFADRVKLGVLAGSILSGVAGYAVLRLAPVRDDA